MHGAVGYVPGGPKHEAKDKAKERRWVGVIRPLRKQHSAAEFADLLIGAADN